MDEAKLESAVGMSRKWDAREEKLLDLQLKN